MSGFKDIDWFDTRENTSTPPDASKPDLRLQQLYFRWC